MKIRAYLKSEIMDHTEYMVNYHSGKNGPEAKYFFRGLPINFSAGSFYMDIDSTIRMVPGPLIEFLSEKYSIHDCYNSGLLHVGLYQSDQFDQASGNITKFISDVYNIEINGTDLGHVLGLYKLIINNELLPVSLSGGKSPVQIIEDLQKKVSGLSVELEFCQGCLGAKEVEINDLVRLLKFGQEIAQDLQKKIAEAEAKRPWYRKWATPS